VRERVSNDGLELAMAAIPTTRSFPFGAKPRRPRLPLSDAWPHSYDAGVLDLNVTK